MNKTVLHLVILLSKKNVSKACHRVHTFTLQAGIIEDMLEDTFESMEDGEDMEEAAEEEVDRILFEITAGKEICQSKAHGHIYALWFCFVLLAGGGGLKYCNDWFCFLCQVPLEKRQAKSRTPCLIRSPSEPLQLQMKSQRRTLKRCSPDWQP